jgi:cobalt-zinc-cadmium efflux system membrane fusion protein
MWTRTHTFICAALSLLSLAGGGLLGIRYRGSEATASVATADQNDHDDEHDDHVDVSPAAARSLGLRVEPVHFGRYVKHLHIPAVVMEKPGQSGLNVTAPAQGVVRQIYCTPGQALRPGDRLFTLQLTDEALESAQLTVLDTLTQITVAQRELARLVPLAESGAVIGRRKLELEYELKKLLSERSARLQELRLRGLSQSQIEHMIEQRELVAEIDIYLEVAASQEFLTNADGGDPDQVDPDLIFTVEQLDVFPGRAVRKGEELCHIANHRELFLRGEAFAADVAAIHQLGRQDWKVTAVLGDDLHQQQLDGLTINYVDNHVDRQTQTFPFYLSLANQIVAENRDNAGRLFPSWKFKPGQRAHLLIPVAEWSDQWVLPREAVVRSGVESFVFRLENAAELRDWQQLETLLAAGPPDESTREMLQQRLTELTELEFEPVEVAVIHQDRYQSVIAADGLLHPGQLIAMNQAYQLLLAWKLQQAGGGGHHHDH